MIRTGNQTLDLHTDVNLQDSLDGPRTAENCTLLGEQGVCLLFPQTPAEPYAEQPNVPWPKHS
jgi:hypothetical protein